MHPLGTETDDSVRIASANKVRASVSNALTNGALDTGSPVHDQDKPSWFDIVVSFHRNIRYPRQPQPPPLPKIHRISSVGELVWYSTTMDPTTASLIQDRQHEHDIKYIIPDLPVKMYGRTQKSPPSWGLDRIDQRSDKLDGIFHYPSSSGENVTIYIIDTGVNIDHQDFEGRARHGPVFLPSTTDNADNNGHGTFVAAVAAGTTYGVAKKASIVSLKALDDAGAGRLSNVLAAIEWVVRQHVAQGESSRSIINLSLGAEHNEPTNAAIQEAMRLGVHFAIAAGNDGQNACKFSPASTPGALIVGATDQDDTIASYSNYGPCVAIYAPGSNIVSAWAGSRSATHTQSGTSMASPHVAGLIALMLSEGSILPENYDQSNPVKFIADRILQTVTKFSLDGELVTDFETPSSSTAVSLSPSFSSSSSLLSSSFSTLTSTDPSTSQSHPPKIFHGKALARNLVYVGDIPDRINETEITRDDDPHESILISLSSSSKTFTSVRLALAIPVAYLFASAF
ncbi:hypothetical protein BGZ83_005580 [Gryganskiella cystojenkinii]|nr:hypothetical protein BGZ83_005580 [Gryganskiella cystojenkinii]